MYSVIFYRTGAGNEPALEWFRALDQEERRIIGFDLRTLQIGFPMGMPLCRSLGNDLWELRSTLPRKIARVLFFIDGETFVILHGFIKKSQKTPKQDIEAANARMKAYRGR